jgi:hypothetical protein
MTPSVIESPTILLVAQCLIHLHQRVSQQNNEDMDNITCRKYLFLKGLRMASFPWRREECPLRVVMWGCWNTYFPRCCVRTVRSFRRREESYGMRHIQITVSVSFVACRFPISVNLNEVTRNRNTFLQRCKQPIRCNKFFVYSFFKSALHVSDDKFANPQEHFLNVCTAFGTMHRSAAVTVHCTKSCIYSQKVLLRMGEFVARNM